MANRATSSCSSTRSAMQMLTRTLQTRRSLTLRTNNAHSWIGRKRAPAFLGSTISSSSNTSRWMSGTPSTPVLEFASGSSPPTSSPPTSSSSTSSSASTSSSSETPTSPSNDSSPPGQHSNHKPPLKEQTKKSPWAAIFPEADGPGGMWASLTHPVIPFLIFLIAAVEVAIIVRKNQNEEKEAVDLRRERLERKKQRASGVGGGSEAMNTVDADTGTGGEQG